MRILKAVQAYFPFHEMGGPVVKVRALARELGGSGHKVTVLTADLGLVKTNFRRDTLVEPCRWGWRAEEQCVEAIYLSTLGRFRAVTLNPRAVGFCRTLLQEFDIVHFYGLYDLLGPTVSYFCRLYGIPYVIEPMGMYKPIVRNVRLKRMYHTIFGNRFVAGARYLIATSDQERQELIESGVESSQVVIRRNGIDLPEAPPVPGSFRRRWNIPSETKIILFLGRLVSKKSPDLLLDAFAELKDQNAMLVLAGPDERDGFLSRLKATVNRYGVVNRVLFTGPLFEEAKWSAYCDADVFVLPSQNENFGNTAGEAAACGTPIIVTDQCGIAPFLRNAGLVTRHDVKAIANALEEILADPLRRERFEKGREDVHRNLSWAEPLKQMAKLYRQCVQENRGG